MIGIIKKLFGSKYQRDLKALGLFVRDINAIEEDYQKLSDDQVRGKTAEFRERLAKGE